MNHERLHTYWDTLALFDITWFPFSRVDTSYLFVVPVIKNSVVSAPIYFIDHVYGRRAYRVANSLDDLAQIVVELHSNHEIDLRFNNPKEINSFSISKLTSVKRKTLSNFIVSNIVNL